MDLAENHRRINLLLLLNYYYFFEIILKKFKISLFFEITFVIFHFLSKTYILLIGRKLPKFLKIYFCQNFHVMIK